MSARLAGKRGTPDRVVELLKNEVAKTSQAATARATGLTLRGVQNYLKGIGDPTQATLEKLAAYFGVSVGWLRGQVIDFNDAKPLALCAECGGPLQASAEGFLRIMPDGTEVEGDGVLRFWPCPTCCKE